MNSGHGSKISNAYLDAVAFFEDFELSFHNSLYDNSSTTAKDLGQLLNDLKICNQKVQTLISMEFNLKKYMMPLCQLCRQIEQEIAKIEAKLNPPNISNNPYTSKYGDPPVTAHSYTSNLPPTKRQCTARTNTERERQFMDAIENMKVVPTAKGLKDIAGLDTIKKVLRTMTILPKRQPQLYNGQILCNSVLLYGPPGTGKTKIVQALAVESKSVLYSLSSSDIMSQYVGQTERMVKAVFQHIKSTSEYTILFIDEIDGLCRKRNEGEHEHIRRLKTELLSQFSSIQDNTNAFIICATNCPWDLDNAFVRRFHKRLYVPLPNREERLEFFQIYTQGTPLANTLHNWGPLLNETDGYSYSDLDNLLRHALFIPLTELEDIKMWQLRVDGFYEPWNDHSFDGFENSVFCDLSNLPPGTVKSREVEINDLMSALSVVQKTVNAEDIKKFEEYLKKN